MENNAELLELFWLYLVFGWGYKRRDNKSHGKLLLQFMDGKEYFQISILNKPLTDSLLYQNRRLISPILNFVKKLICHH